MPNDRDLEFLERIEQVIEETKQGFLLHEEICDELIQQGLEVAPVTTAKALRKLGEIVDWYEFSTAQRFYEKDPSYPAMVQSMTQWREDRGILRNHWMNPANWPSKETLAERRMEHRRKFRGEGSYFRELKAQEEFLGFDQGAMDKLIEFIGPWHDFHEPYDFSFVDEVSFLPPDVCFPIQQRQVPIFHSSYDSQRHRLLLELSIRFKDHRSLGYSVKSECGHVLAHAHLPYEREGAELILSQLLRLADVHYRSRPDDVVGICWRGILACWDGDEQMGREYASRLFFRARTAGHEELAKLFDLITYFDHYPENKEPWGTLEPPTTAFHEIRESWIDHDESLVMAIIRSLCSKTMSNYALTLIAEYVWELDPGSLTSEQWLWLRENVVELGIGHDWQMLYVVCRENARKAIKHSTVDSSLFKNIFVAEIAPFVFREENTGIKKEYLTGLIDDLIEYSRASTLFKGNTSLDEAIERAINVVEEVLAEKREIGNSAESWSDLKDEPESESRYDEIEKEDPVFYKKLLEFEKMYPPPTRMSPVGAFEFVLSELNRLKAAMQELRREQRAYAKAELENTLKSIRKQAGDSLRLELAEKVWSKLHGKAKEDFLRAASNYEVARSHEGDSGDFNSVVMAFSHGLLKHIQASVKGPFKRNPQLRDEYRKQFVPLVNKESGVEYPEWRELIEYMKQVANYAGTNYGQKLLAQGVRLDKVADLILDFIEVSKYRAKAAHTFGGISREDMPEIYNKLVNDGIIQRVVEYFPLPPSQR